MIRRMLVAAALSTGLTAVGLMAPTVVKAGPITWTQTTTVAIANDVGATPAPVKTEAHRVHAEADLDRISAPARHYLTTPVRDVVTVTGTQAGKPASSAGATLWYGAGCWNVWEQHTSYNSVGWVLTTAQVRVNNWCSNGQSTITTTPWYQTIETTHWGWSFCGLNNSFGGWFYYPWDWGAGATFQFSVGPCVSWALATTSPVVYVYGNGTWNAS